MNWARPALVTFCETVEFAVTFQTLVGSTLTFVTSNAAPVQVDPVRSDMLTVLFGSTRVSPANTRNGRLYLRKVEIQLGTNQRGGSYFDGGLRSLLALRPLVEDVGSDRLRRDQRFGPVQLLVGQHKLGFRLRKLAFGLLGRGLSD
jgi:hypothetical protein